MVGENFGIDSSELAKTALKLSMVGVNFVIYSSQLAKNALKIVHHSWRKFCNLLMSVG